MRQMSDLGLLGHCFLRSKEPSDRGDRLAVPMALPERSGLSVRHVARRLVIAPDGVTGYNDGSHRLYY